MSTTPKKPSVFDRLSTPREHGQTGANTSEQGKSAPQGGQKKPQAVQSARTRPRKLDDNDYQYVPPPQPDQPYVVKDYIQLPEKPQEPGQAVPKINVEKKESVYDRLSAPQNATGQHVYNYAKKLSARKMAGSDLDFLNDYK